MLLTTAVAAVALVVLRQRDHLLMVVPFIAFAVFAFAAPRAAALSLLPIGVLVPMVFEVGIPGNWVLPEVTASTATVCVVLVACSLGLRLLYGRLRLSVEHVPVAALGALILIGYLAPPVVVEWGHWSGSDRHFPGLLVCLVMLAVVMVTKPKPAHLLNVFIWSAVAVAVFAFVHGSDGGGRLRTVAYLSTCLGMLEGPAVVACLALARARRAARWLVPAAICFACVFASQSRAGILATAVGAVFVLVAGRPTLFRIALLSVAGAALGLVLKFGVGVGELLAPWRDESGIASSDVQRFEILQFSLRLITEHPLRGVGYGNLVQLIDYTPRYGERSGAHNDYLRIAAENGIPALVVFLVILYRAVRPHREGDLGAVRAVVVSSMVWISTEVNLPHPAWSAFFWISLACLLAARRSGEGEIKADHSADSGARARCSEFVRQATPAGEPVLIAGADLRKSDAMCRE
ncbi:O-antigen ligase family protein [Sphaerisporangium perillae]|uniref:O-antigen ligase family protein n=1 Tax=Sphaerisporangium perillae TaxID=2935860 RepID=UPI00200E996A|nr:O-antigen ligase family protein [Sphaerisporangium perillae]